MRIVVALPSYARRRLRKQSPPSRSLRLVTTVVRYGVVAVDDDLHQTWIGRCMHSIDLPALDNQLVSEEVPSVLEYSPACAVGTEF